MSNPSQFAKVHTLSALVLLAGAGPLARAEVTLKSSVSSVVEGDPVTFSAERTDRRPGSWIFEYRPCSSAEPWRPMPPVAGAPDHCRLVAPLVPGPGKFEVRAIDTGSGAISPRVQITVLPAIAGMAQLLATPVLGGAEGWMAGSPPAMSLFAEKLGRISTLAFWDGQGGETKGEAPALPRGWLVGTRDGKLLAVGTDGKVEPIPGMDQAIRLTPGERSEIAAIAVQPYREGQPRAIVLAVRTEDLRSGFNSNLWLLEPGRPLRHLAGLQRNHVAIRESRANRDSRSGGQVIFDAAMDLTMTADGVCYLIEGYGAERRLRQVARDGATRTLTECGFAMPPRDGQLTDGLAWSPERYASEATSMSPSHLTTDGEVVYFTDGDMVRMLTPQHEVITLVPGVVPMPRPLGAEARPLGQMLRPGTRLARLKHIQRLGRYLFIGLEGGSGDPFGRDIVVFDLDSHLMWTLFGGAGADHALLRPGLLKPFAPAGTGAEACAGLGRKSLPFCINAEGVCMVDGGDRLLSLDLGPFGEETESLGLDPGPAEANLWPLDRAAGAIRSADGVAHPRFLLDLPADGAPVALRHEVPCRSGQVLTGRAWVSAAGLRDGQAGIGLQFDRGEGTPVLGQDIALGPDRPGSCAAQSRRVVEVLGVVPEGATRAVLILSAQGHPYPGASAVFKDVDFRCLADPAQPNLRTYGSDAEAKPAERFPNSIP